MKTITGLFSVVYLDSFSVFPEYFIGISCIYILIVVVLITYNVYGLMIQKALSECIALILFMSCYLLINDDLLTHTFAGKFLSFHKSMVNDNLAFFTKFIVCFSSALYFLIIANFLKQYRLTSFEYLLITLFAVLGLILLCGSNDLLTVYLAIELTSLASYILASFKKTSSYSIESGLKYFVTGAISSAFFLLGSSFIYGQIATVNFMEINRMCETAYFDRYPICCLNFDDITPEILAKLYMYALVTNQVSFGPDERFYDWYEFALYSSSLVDLGLALILFSLFIKLGLAPFSFMGARCL